ncbi:MAG: hydantoinase/oxoprolinase family protein, partial [Pseudomonadota bacterium]
SIAYMDSGGAFRVGPRSAGADPGPACYGQGGTEPTVTDAQVVLGRLDPDQFLGGDLTIDEGLARQAIETHIAKPLSLSVEDAALGILRIINNNMALAINANSVAKGIDPRAFTLMGFGGAGPLHATALAEIIQTRDVISPLQPGITAAMGLLVTDLQYEYTHSVLTVMNTASDEELDELNTRFDELRALADVQLDADNVPQSERVYKKVAECRYVGQGFELRADVPEGPLTADNKQSVVDAFFDAHKQVYGHAFKDQLTEAITLRLIASAATGSLNVPDLSQGGRVDPQEALMYTRQTRFDDGQSLDTPRFRRPDLRAEDRVNGPAIIVQHNSTTLVPPGWSAHVIAHGDLRLSRAS